MKWILTCLLAFSACANAALQVYDSTCATPTAPKHTWYVDAVNGDDVAGDGSQAKPWKTLQAIFQPTSTGWPKLNTVAFWHPVAGIGWTTAPEPGQPVKPGDQILLMTGSYGDVNIGTYNTNTAMSDWLTVGPATGQAPVIGSLHISGINKLYFHNLKVQSQVKAMIALSGQGAFPTDDAHGISQFPAQDIIFDHMTISSADDVSTWLAADWNAKAMNAFNIYPFTAHCIALTNSLIKNAAGGVGIGGEKVLVAGNTFDHLRDDYVDFYGNYLNINHNTLKNSLSVSAIHKDFFQGQIGHRFAGTTTNHYHDIVIDSNTMIGNDGSDKSLAYVYTQGIDTFDEDWTNLTATNNVIITSACHGIGFSSVHGGEIAHNTVLADHLMPMPGGCVPGIGAGGTSHESTLVTDHVNVHHNYADAVGINLDDSNTAENNLCHGDSCNMVLTKGGVTTWNVGSYGTNKSDKSLTQFIPSIYRFNVHVVPGSLADQMGAGAAR